jgi:hypothetical protein
MTKVDVWPFHGLGKNVVWHCNYHVELAFSGLIQFVSFFEGVYFSSSTQNCFSFLGGHHQLSRAEARSQHAWWDAWRWLALSLDGFYGDASFNLKSIVNAC